jgi:voltage-gated potassium channel
MPYEDVVVPSKRINYEIFIIILTVLSWINMILIFILSDTNGSYVIKRVELFLTIIFFLDFFFRLKKADSRSTYFRKIGWLDLIGCVPFMRWTRAYRVYRTTQYIRKLKGNSILKDFFQNRAETAALTVILAVVFLFEFASIFILQAEAGAMDANIVNGEDAMWWVLVTVATVGYGDLYPVTDDGRRIAGFVIFVGVGLFGVLSGFLTQNFLGGNSNQTIDTIVKNTAETTQQQVDQLLDELKEIRQFQAVTRSDQEAANEKLHKRLAAVEKMLNDQKQEE